MLPAHLFDGLEARIHEIRHDAKEFKQIFRDLEVHLVVIHHKDARSLGPKLLAGSRAAAQLQAVGIIPDGRLVGDLLGDGEGEG